MPHRKRQAAFGARFFRHLWRMTRVYWLSADAPKGLLLLLVAVALELLTVYSNVLMADAQKRLFDAVEAKQMGPFFNAVTIFLSLVAAFLLVSTYRIYVRQVLEMRWRQSLTAHYLKHWMGPEAYAQRELRPTELDNPDQRIAEDIRNFVASALGLSLSLLAALATLYSFATMLSTLSSEWPIPYDGTEIHIPGLMLWVAVIYAILATGLTHLVGRRLVPINFDRQRVEADFRYGLMRFRDNVESVALAGGERVERSGALTRFQQVINNWLLLIAAQRNLNLFTGAVGQINGLLPIFVAAPAYIAGKTTLGAVAQSRVAYMQVSGALAWFVYAYQEIAQWRASVERLSTFTEVMQATHVDLQQPPVIDRHVGRDGLLRLIDLHLELPTRKVLLDGANAEIEPGEHIAVLGPAGAGKTTLFRAIAGMWPFGAGSIELPADASLLFLPQHPYLPIGTLREAITYPSPGDQFTDEEIYEALRLLELQRLEGHIDETAEWDQRLSGDEQQRLTFARVLLHKPDWVFLDDSTASLDESMEKRVYDIIAERLPKTTVVSMTHRPTVARYHGRCWLMEPNDQGTATLRTR